ncbi:hypothetical protein [Faecalibacter sp. LW9]|uniref:hypothetical protein n=1 Tax=Faecalibacter sp. LW9 TaxID=3103144 RepID=UPI002AFE6397|nr:hypothetical protein [Faecalibacter sp. LW9]
MKKLLLSGLVLLSIFTITSCTEKDKNEIETTNVNEDLKDKLVVTVEGVFPKNDRLQLFYSNDSKFDEKQSLFEAVYGQTVLQEVVFVLPNNVKPQQLRLDLGENPNQTNITIKDIKVEYNGLSIEHEPEKFREYFEDTYFTVYNPTTREYDLRANDNNVFDPILMGSEKLKRSLNSLYNNSNKQTDK